MAKGQLKTTKTKTSVAGFIAAIDNKTRPADAKRIDELFRDISGEKPALWGPTIIGYGVYHYTYDSGREGDMPKLGFSPRKANLVLYVILPESKEQAGLLKKLGKHKTGKACLYINTLADVDETVLREITQGAWDYMTKKYG